MPSRLFSACLWRAFDLLMTLSRLRDPTPGIALRAVHRAVQRGDESAVRSLVGRFGPRILDLPHGPQGRTALAQSVHPSTRSPATPVSVSALLELGADPDVALDSGGEHLLLVLAERADDALYDALEAGADPCVADPADGRPPLVWSVLRGQYAHAHALLEAGADPSQTTSRPVFTPNLGHRSLNALELAEREFNPAMVQLLRVYSGRRRRARPLRAAPLTASSAATGG